MNTDKDTASRVKLAEAILRVTRKRHDFQDMIFTGHREMMAQMSGVDPFVSLVQMQNGLEETGEPLKAAQLQLVEAALHVWYKVTPEVQSMVYQAVRELAMIDGIEETTAMMEAGLILDNARSSATAMNELRASVDKKNAERQQARNQSDAQLMRQRLSNEGLL